MSNLEFWVGVGSKFGGDGGVLGQRFPVRGASLPPCNLPNKKLTETVSSSCSLELSSPLP